MFAMYDTIEKKYATVLNFPYFGRSLDWVDSISGPPVVGKRHARVHKTKATMKGQLTQLMWRLNMNVEMLAEGAWDDRPDMLTWSIECKRRLDAGYTDFGMEVVEIKS